MVGAGPAPPFQLADALKSVLPAVFLQTCCASTGGGVGVGVGFGLPPEPQPVPLLEVATEAEVNVCALTIPGIAARRRIVTSDK